MGPLNEQAYLSKLKEQFMCKQCFTFPGDFCLCFQVLDELQ